LFTLSKHTHVQIELRTEDNKYVALTLDGSTPKIFKLGLQKKFLGEMPYDWFSVGSIFVDEADVLFILNYPASNCPKILWFQLCRMCGITLETPKTCTTFIGEFLNRFDRKLPVLFSPKELWRYLNDCDYDRR